MSFDHRLFLTFDLCVGFHWIENVLPDRIFQTFDLWIGSNSRENFLPDHIIISYFGCMRLIHIERDLPF